MLTNIEAERVRAQMTKEQIAERLGITSKTYNNYVSEVHAIPSDVLLKMARMFSCRTDYLLGVNPADAEKGA